MLYLCTDARRDRGDLAEFADAALAGGVDIIQLRDKGSAAEHRLGPLEARDELAALEVLADAARRHGALLAVNDRADIARAAGAAVLHLGQDDLPLSVAREIVGPDTVIGRSTHDRQQVGAAITEDVDYFCVGPCWPTPTKPGRTGARAGAGACHRRAGVRQTLVRHRRHRRGPTAGGAGRRRAAHRRRPGYHRRGGSASRGRAAQFGTCSSELIRELSCDGA